mmetsp:Transcript_2199/g.3432  ORF Transcript_2199/g.3432 Transcript_2199/m.3432 type:complete len:309 (+) Transcript_2199:191-1117(+)
MTSLDLMRAAVPVFQPVDSPNIRSGFLSGEHRDTDEDGANAGSAAAPPISDFFKLFDTDGDGLVSFPEYVFFITLLSLPERKVKSIFLQFDVDKNGGLDRAEFIDMMKTMRGSTSRGKASGYRTGLMATNVDNLSSGLVHHFFGDPGVDQHNLSLEQLEHFLHDLRSEIDQLEFRHYDFTRVGSISVEDFGYSVVAGANVRRMQYFIDRCARLTTSSGEGAGAKRVSRDQFMAFGRLLKHGESRFEDKIKNHVRCGGTISRAVFLKLAAECGAALGEAQVDVLFSIFDVDNDGELSLQELLEVVCRWD